MSVNPIKTLQQDPNEQLDYTIDWIDWLAGDTISTVTWTVQTGLTNAGSMYSSTTATIWLSGGTSGTSYTVACKITTVGLRTAERTFQVSIVDR